MKINMKNKKVGNSVVTYECNLKKKPACLIWPTEMGSYKIGKTAEYNHDKLGLGVLVGSKTSEWATNTIDVIQIESDSDYNKWCLVNYTGYYRYVIATAVEISDFDGPDYSEEEPDGDDDTSSSSSNPWASDGHLDSSAIKDSLDADPTNVYIPDYLSGYGTPYKRLYKYISGTDTALVYLTDAQKSAILGACQVNAATVREYPTYLAKGINCSHVANMINQSTVFPVQSMYQDCLDSVGRKYYLTTFFSDNENVTTSYAIPADLCTFVRGADLMPGFSEFYYSMCHSPGSIKGYRLGDGANPGAFTHGDLMVGHFSANNAGEDYYQITCFDGYLKEAIKPVSYNDFSPNAHSSDWFNSNYLGKIQNTSSTANCRKIDLSKFWSGSSKDSHRLKSKDLSFWLKLSGGPADVLDSAAWGSLSSVLHTASNALMTYNRVTQNGKSYYIAAVSGASNRGYWYFIEDDGSLNWVSTPNGYSENYTADSSAYQDATGYESWGTIDIDDLNVSDGYEAVSEANTLTKKYTGDPNEENYWKLKFNIDTDWGVPGIIEGVDDKFIDEVEQWSDAVDILHDAVVYEGHDYAPIYSLQDQTHLNRINRFKLMPSDSGLSTKSFIFMTRPDLNLFALDSNENPISGQMNPDLKRLPTFKYIARLQYISAVMGSLCISSANGTNKTPWLSIMSNQATGYSIEDRRLDTTEIGETFHGNRIIYAEPTFSHKIAGTVSIPFRERRDLSLYFTLRMWIDYIQAVTLGRASPRRQHILNMILDYASSIYYIQTDETMENIIYWEKLVGVFPLTVPDSFFSWDSRTPERNMEYTIDFAYSQRVSMDEMTLFEINNLYSFQDLRMNGLAYWDGYSMSHNKDYDRLIATVADTFGTFDNDRTGFPNKFLEGGGPDNRDPNVAFFNNTVSDPSLMRRFYYANKGQFAGWKLNGALVPTNGYDIQIQDSDGNISYQKRQFLPNFIPDIGMHGTPFVTGPFITKEKDRYEANDSVCGTEMGAAIDNGQYKLRWI